MTGNIVMDSRPLTYQIGHAVSEEFPCQSDSSLLESQSIETGISYSELLPEDSLYRSSPNGHGMPIRYTKSRPHNFFHESEDTSTLIPRKLTHLREIPSSEQSRLSPMVKVLKSNDYVHHMPLASNNIADAFQVDIPCVSNQGTDIMVSIHHTIPKLARR